MLTRVRQPSLRDQVFVSFDLLAGLPSQIATSVAEQVIAGLIRIVRAHQDIVRSSTEWNLVFALLRSTLGNHEAARQAFELMTALVNDGPERYVTSDNYPGIVAVLDEFMTAASMAVEAQQQGRRNQTLNASK